MTENFGESKVCSPGVLAASTLSSFDSTTERPRLPSLVFDSLGHKSVADHKAAMRLTDRDRAIIELVARARALRDDQIQMALFSANSTSRCQRRLTLLVRNRYLDRLPGRSVSEPAVYVLTRRSTAGNRFVRAQWGEIAFRNHMTKIGSLPHLLGINDVRVRVERACFDLGWTLLRWRRSEDLQQRLQGQRLIPDAYFTIQQQPNSPLASFFLELERSAKSLQVLRSKLLRYATLYHRQETQPRERSMQVLFVFDEPHSVGAFRRIEPAKREAERLGLPFVRFLELQPLRKVTAEAVLTEPLWIAPGRNTSIALLNGKGS